LALVLFFRPVDVSLLYHFCTRIVEKAGKELELTPIPELLFIHKFFGTRMTRIKLIYTDFLINKMKIKKNNLGKTDLNKGIIMFLFCFAG